MNAQNKISPFLLVRRKTAEVMAVQYTENINCGWVVLNEKKRICYYNIEENSAIEFHRKMDHNAGNVLPAWGNVNAASGDWLVSFGDGILYTYTPERFEAEFIVSN